MPKVTRAKETKDSTDKAKQMSYLSPQSGMGSKFVHFPDYVRRLNNLSGQTVVKENISSEARIGMRDKIHEAFVENPSASWKQDTIDFFRNLKSVHKFLHQC